MIKQRVAVIGAAGFIGTHLTRRLQMTDADLFTAGRGVTNRHPSLPYVQIDPASPAQMAEAFRKTALVYYLASETNPITSWEKPQMEVEKNLAPFLNFLEAAAEAGVRRIVYLSSAGTVYGQSDTKIKEDQDKRPFSPYGIMKLCMEHFLNYAEARHGIRYDIYRVSNAYGEGQDTSKGLGLINTLIERIIAGREIDIYGDGGNRRNFIYIKDVAELLTLSMNDIEQPSAIYNLASNDTLTVNEIVAAIKEIASEEIKLRRLPARPSDNPMIDLDNSRILHHFPAFSFTPLNVGIRNTYKHMKSHKPETGQVK